MTDRPTALKFLGTYADYGNGRMEPDRFLYGIPARDLDAGDILLLTDEDLLRIASVQPPLYQVTEGAPLPTPPVDVPPAETATPSELEALNMAELRARAAERDIEGRSSMNKTELIEAINAWTPPAPPEDDADPQDDGE